MPRKLTREEVIEQFRRTHGDKYDYSQVNYNNNSTKVSIVCSKHGVFQQIPADHKAGIGCIQCGFSSMKEKQRLSKDVLIAEFKKAHQDRYDYSKVEYVNTKTSVLIICKKHGEFRQKPEFHKDGHGCPKCGVEKNADAKRLSLEDVVKRFKSVHGERYDYSKVKYTNNSTPVEIICCDHGAFFQEPYRHMSGANCPTCAFFSKSRGCYYTQERLISEFTKIHGDTYNYERVSFYRIDKPILITCKKHGDFNQLPYVHKSGSGCPTCAGQNLDTSKVVDQFREMHGNHYDYSLVEYSGVGEKVKIICTIHGVFEQLPSSHKSGNGCPSCGDYGFDSNKPAILYYLKIDSGVAYKIGITNSTVEERFKRYDLDRIEVLFVWEFDKGSEARSAEKDVLSKYVDYRYRGLALLSSGNTELFYKDILGLDSNSCDEV